MKTSQFLINLLLEICLLHTTSANSNPRPGETVTIHVVTHSHLDAGWVYPVDRCYQTVAAIFDSVLEALLLNSERKYTVGDMYFFRRWYTGLRIDQQASVKELVRNGRVEIVHGGAVSTDEATVSFHDMIDNMMGSRHWIQKEFGVIPDIGWQLDAFGHSAANARFFAEIGIEALVFARMPDALLAYWADNRMKDFIWQPEFATTTSESPGLFAHALYDHYSAPGGLEYFNGGNSMKTVQALPDLRHVRTYVDIVRDYGYGQANQYKHNQVLLLFGDDFAHPQAESSYQLMDAIIGNMKSEADIVIKYSTVHDYIEGIKAEAARKNIVWPVYTDDLFPQFTDQAEYWSGYYTTDPFIKRSIR